MNKRVEQVVTARRRARHLFLLISLVVLFLVSPFIMTHRFGVVVLNIVGAAVLLSGTFALSERRVLLVIAICLVVIAISINLSLIVFPAGWLVQVSYISMFLLLSLFSINILLNVLRSERVTADKIFAAICVYLLVAYAWTFAYAIVESNEPGSFSGLEMAGTSDRIALVMEMRYFSFVTLTTVGYGDISPHSPVARTFATLEAVMGQIYLTVLVARLVGLHIANSTGPPEGRRD